MGKVKYDYSKQLEVLNKRKSVLMTELERIGEIERDLESSLWKYQNEKCVEEYNEIDADLFNFEKLSDREIAVLLGRRKQIIKFLSIRDYIGMKDKFSEELKDVNDKIREYRSKQS